MSLQEARRKRRKELEMFYTDAKKQTAFFKFLESPKTTCPARNFLFWLDVEAYRLQRRLAKSGGASMGKFNDFDVCNTIYCKYVRAGAPYPIFMPNYTKLDIAGAMEKFEAAVRQRGSGGGQLTAMGEHVFDEAQNAVEVSLYRALTQFERALQQENKVIDAVVSTDNEGHSVFVTGSFGDLMNWFFLDCEDEKWELEMRIFLYMYRAFETPQGLFEAISRALREPDSLTTNSFDKDLIIARTRQTLRFWMTAAYYCDIEGDQELVARILELVSFAEREYDDHELRKFVQRFLERPIDFPNPVSARSRDVDLGRWTASEVAQQLTLLDSYQYYACSPEELFSVGDTDGSPHLTTLAYRVQFVGRWVSTAIVRSPKPGNTLRMFVAVLEQLFSLNNYNGVEGVLRGVYHQAVLRLKKAWKPLDKNERQFLLEIRQLMETTSLYRRHLETLGDVPCVPHTSVHVQLMSQAYSRNVNKMQTERGINYQPMRSVAEVMYHFLRFQPFKYAEARELRVNDDLYNQLMHVSALGDTELMAASVALQPLDRKEKRGEAVEAEAVLSPRSPPLLSGLLKKSPRRKIRPQKLK